MADSSPDSARPSGIFAPPHIARLAIIHRPARSSQTQCLQSLAAFGKFAFSNSARTPSNTLDPAHNSNLLPHKHLQLENCALQFCKSRKAIPQFKNRFTMSPKTRNQNRSAPKMQAIEVRPVLRYNSLFPFSPDSS